MNKLVTRYLLLVTCYLLLVTNVYANTTHTVKKGDTLYNISKKYSIPEKEIRKINNLKTNRLKVGQKLAIKKHEEKENEARHSESPVLDAKNPQSAVKKIQEIKALSSSEDIKNLSIRERLPLFAKKMLHIPYKFGGNSVFGIDCSAYVQKVYSISGIDLPRTAREQFTVGEKIDKDELTVGDLVFFKTYASFPSHVGIYLGNNLFIHASRKSRKITIDSLDSPYYLKRFIGAKRLITDEE